MSPFEISSLDIFGSKITFNYKNDSVYRTSFGGLMTLAMVSFLTLLFFRSVNISTKRKKRGTCLRSKI